MPILDDVAGVHSADSSLNDHPERRKIPKNYPEIAIE